VKEFAVIPIGGAAVSIAKVTGTFDIEDDTTVGLVHKSVVVG
jgi:hypothetical protein